MLALHKRFNLSELAKMQKAQVFGAVEIHLIGVNIHDKSVDVTRILHGINVHEIYISVMQLIKMKKKNEKKPSK